MGQYCRMLRFIQNSTLVSSRMAIGAQYFDKHALLRAHPFFKDLGQAIIERLAPRIISTKVKKGSVIFRKGDLRLEAICGSPGSGENKRSVGTGQRRNI